MKHITRTLSLVLTLALLLGTLLCLPLTAAAASDDGISFGSSSLYTAAKPYSSTPTTFEAWINLPKSAASGRAGIILGNYGDAVPCINFEIHPNGRPRLYWSDTSGTTDWIFTNVNVCTGEWLHLTIVRDEAKNEVRCYVDGALAATLKITKDTRDLRCTEPFVLGGDWRAENSMFFRGRIRSVAVYSDVRTEDEINGDMIEPDLDDALIAHYDLSTLTEDGLLEDLSGNGYDIKKGKQVVWIPEEDKEPVTDFDYTFVAVGDTQVLAQKHQDRFHLVYDWIMDNKDEKNIKFVMGLGDITETSADKEWEIAMENILRMEGVIPFSLVRGNHDSTATFNRYFPYDEYEYLVDGTYGESMINSWQKFTVGNRKYIVFTLDYGASDAVLNWAADIIEKHPDYNVILTTHCYLFRDGTTLDQGDVCPPATTGGHNNGDHMWDKLVKNHENIVLVLNGHDPCSRIVTSQDEGENGNIVTQMLIDAQGVDASMGGLGMVAALHFSEDSDEIQVEYYSTFKEQYFRPENQFTVTLDFVGEDPIDESRREEGEQPPVDEQPSEEDPTPDDGEKEPVDDDTVNEQHSETVGVSGLILIIIIAAVIIVALVVALVIVVLKSKKAK
ncbi:MAG: metallophosphoesterase [Clostridia bacterium]|nr:metallophosphoesterase [Clostridia bacterium]